jgi:hypothetical protein
MQQLLSDVCSTPDSSAALSFLARVIKNSGAVHQAVQLYKKAVQVQPGSSSYALGLAQTLELDHEYAAVLQVLLQYCEACKSKWLGPLQLKVSDSRHILGLRLLFCYVIKSVPAQLKNLYSNSSTSQGL